MSFKPTNCTTLNSNNLLRANPNAKLSYLQAWQSYKGVRTLWVTIIHALFINSLQHEFRLFFFFVAQQFTVGQGLFIIEASISHSGTPQLVGLLWTSDQPDAGTSTHDKQHNIHPPMSPTESEPAVPGSERPQTHTLDRADTQIGVSYKHYTHLQFLHHTMSQCASRVHATHSVH